MQQKDLFQLDAVQLRSKTRWTAAEDLNIYFYVHKFGSTGLNSNSYWKLGTTLGLWRPTKTKEALRSRFRFYVRFLKHDNLRIIRDFLKDNPVAFNNFRSRQDCNQKDWYSVLVTEKVMQRRTYRFRRNKKINFQKIKVDLENTNNNSLANYLK